jgi:hypothetical protein
VEPSTWNQREEARLKDRTGWQSGAWDTEPDRIEWRWLGPPRLACLIVRGPSGALCGYVGVPPGHPYHGRDYGKCDVDVHGSLTYSDKCAEGGQICHVARLGEADDVWWLGFDCAHSNDVKPTYTDELREVYATYKPIGYVRNQVELLAAQLCRVAKGLPAREDQ